MEPYARIHTLGVPRDSADTQDGRIARIAELSQQLLELRNAHQSATLSPETRAKVANRIDSIDADIRGLTAACQGVSNLGQKVGEQMRRLPPLQRQGLGQPAAWMQARWETLGQPAPTTYSQARQLAGATVSAPTALAPPGVKAVTAHAASLEEDIGRFAEATPVRMSSMTPGLGSDLNDLGHLLLAVSLKVVGAFFFAKVAGRGHRVIG